MLNQKQLPHLFIGLVTLLASGSTHAQTTRAKTSNLWSPPGKEFAIEVPSKPKEFDGFGESSDPNSVKNYTTKNSGHIFVVYVLKYKEFATKTTAEKFGGLFFTIGGDDDWEFAEKDR